MSVTTDFSVLASPLVGDRVFPNAAPGATPAPYITYSRIAALEDSTLDANGGSGNPVNTRLQCDVWALTYGSAQVTAAAVKAALKGWAVENVLLDEQDFYEFDTKLHRVMLDFSCWHY